MSITIGQALADARQKIAALDARVLLCHVVQRNAAYLIAHADDLLSPDRQRAFDTLIAHRVGGQPVAYLTGRREFFSLDFRVTQAVLIPRPETELLVQLALERIPPGEPCRVLDLGTGSGCVAISIARYRPRASVIATDNSPEALALAVENARALDVRNVEFAAGEWFGAVAERQFDLIVSNPPYVADGDPHLAQDDARFEPRAALVGGPDGLDAIRLIVACAGPRLAIGGWLLLEHAFDQAGRCRALLQAAGFGPIYAWKDMAGNDRVSGGKLDGLCE